MLQAVQNVKVGSLLSAVDAIRNWRAIVLMFGALLVAGLFWSLGGLLSMKIHPAAGLLFFLAGLTAAFYGVNAVGIMLMDDARGLEHRGLMAAVLESLATGHRLILAFLLFALIYLLGLLAIALVLLICRLPILGPLMFTFVFPLSAVLVGVAMFALQMVVFPLTAPAIWAGATTMQAVSRVGAIARVKVVNVMVMMIVLSLVVLAVVFTIGSILFVGTMVIAAMSAGILDLGVGGGMAQLLSGGFDGGGHFIAASVGGGIVYAVGFSLVSLVFSRGCCTVYLTNLEGVDVDAMEATLRNKLNETRKMAEDMRAKADAMSIKTPAPTPVTAITPAPQSRPIVGPEPVPNAVATTVDMQCPRCRSPYHLGDVFCGECGFRLTS